MVFSRIGEKKGSSTQIRVVFFKTFLMSSSRFHRAVNTNTLYMNQGESFNAMELCSLCLNAIMKKFPQKLHLLNWPFMILLEFPSCPCFNGENRGKFFYKVNENSGIHKIPNDVGHRFLLHLIFHEVLGLELI